MCVSEKDGKSARVIARGRRLGSKWQISKDQTTVCARVFDKYTDTYINPIVNNALFK